MRSILVSLSIALSASGLALACSSSSSPTTEPGVDSGISTTRPDAATNNTTDSGPAEPMQNGCTTYVDHTADPEVTLQWDFGISQKPDHCSMIKVGGKVTWMGDLGTHPVDAHGGDTPNPIAGAGPNSDGGSSVTVTFPNAGIYGYWCDVHMTAMQGAIYVVK
jgi:plastocyanin